ncbi:MAG: pyruvate formate lyase-activating protein [Treponema sp.]|jgi:pyruvate formate lyase activating enzyme|nr:pyruvate formate lyase-activating protein [Treponema sp.]
MSTGFVHSIESCGAVDGPGVRFIIFLSGCPMRCLFCHNPDTWEIGKGEKWEAADLIEEAISCKSYWGKKGGITVSGGEPLVQIDFLIELFTLAKQRGITTCIDTAGGPFSRNPVWFEKFERLVDLTDTFLMDIKIIDAEKHKALTGLPNDNIIDMFHYLDEKKKDVWIRHVLLPGWSDNDAYLEKTRDFIRTLGNIKRVEILPYHTLGVMKYKSLGIPYQLEGVDSPSEERILNAKRILECDKYDGWKN